MVERVVKRNVLLLLLSYVACPTNTLNLLYVSWIISRTVY